MKCVKWTALTVACLAAMGVAGAANDPMALQPIMTKEMASGALAGRVDAQRKRLRLERQYYPRLFQEAYKRYPNIPVGTLEAIAYKQTTWHTLRPDRTGEIEDHEHAPPTWGVMGLSAGESGRPDQVAEAAALLGVTPKEVREHPLKNIMGSAALLNQAMRGAGVVEGNPASLSAALQRYSIFSRMDGEVGEFLRASWARDVLEGLDRGVEEDGIKVPRREVEWERAFPVDMLVKLHAPLLKIDPGTDSVETTLETEDFRVDPDSGQIVPKHGANSKAAVDFPGANWVRSPYYGSRNGVGVREVIIHTIEGTYQGGIGHFMNNPQQVSAHYVLSKYGQVTQMVREANRANHAKYHNEHSIGLEHEGKAALSSTWTEEMIAKSAAITRSICARYSGVTCTNAVRGNPSPTTDVAESIAIKGHGMLSSNANRSDPGAYFDWEGYYNEINGGDSGGSWKLDSFETSVEGFTRKPTEVAGTSGVSEKSTLRRTCERSHGGSCSLELNAKDDWGSSGAWTVRLLSGDGIPANNSRLRREARVGFWVRSSAGGVSVALSVDDSDGSERTVRQSIPKGEWTYVQWRLDREGHWNALGSGANGKIDASRVSFDSLWFYRDELAKSQAWVNFDDIQTHW